MQLCFLANLEPTRVRWANGQVHMTSLKTREVSVKECNGVKYMYGSTLSLSLGWLCAQADRDTHRCCSKILPWVAFWFFILIFASGSSGFTKPVGHICTHSRSMIFAPMASPIDVIVILHDIQ